MKEEEKQAYLKAIKKELDEEMEKLFTTLNECQERINRYFKAIGGITNAF